MLHRDITGEDLHIAKARTGNGSPYGTVVPSVAGEIYVDLLTGNYFTANGLTNTSWILNARCDENAIINGNFAINQRGVSGTVTLAAGAYGHDRWKAGTSGCTYTFSTVNNVTTITITAGSLVQIIEGINLFSGNYALSWEGTAQGKIGSGSYGASGISAAVTGGNNLAIEFGTGTLSKVQLIAGDKALPFKPRIYSAELALCRRYFQKFEEVGTVPQIQVPAVFLFGDLLYSQTINIDQMRIAPTITLSNLAVSTTAASEQTGFTFGTDNRSNRSFRITASKSAHGLSAGAITFKSGGNGYIYLDAEL